MKLIDANQIDFIIAPIAPVLKGEKVHYETVAFAKQISEIPKSKAVPIEELQEIMDAVRMIMMDTHSDTALFAYRRVLEIIESKIKECTE